MKNEIRNQSFELLEQNSNTTNSTTMSTEDKAPPTEVSAEEKDFLKLKEYTMEEISKHNTEDSPWLAIHGRVYDVKEYMDSHPGGPEILCDNAGKDSSEEYDDIGHSDDATDQLKNHIIGRVAGQSFAAASSESGGESGGGGMGLLLALLIPIILGALYYQFVIAAEGNTEL